MCILGKKELRKSEDLGEEEWDKYDGRWIWKKYRGTQHTVLLNISPFSPFFLKKKNTFVSPLLCPFTWLYFPIGKNSLLRASTPTDSLELQFLSSPVLHHSPIHSLLFNLQDASGMFLWKSNTYLPNHVAQNPIPTTSRISNPKTKHN